MRVSRITAAAFALSAAAPSTVWAQGGEGGGGLYDINTGLSFWTLLVFGVLVWVLGKYAWGPILSAVEARETGIQGKLDEAAARNEEAAKLLAEHKEQLADAFGRFDIGGIARKERGLFSIDAAGLAAIQLFMSR